MSDMLRSTLDFVLFAEFVLLVAAFPFLWPWRHQTALTTKWLCGTCETLHTLADVCPLRARFHR